MAVTITSALLRVELGLGDDADGNAKAAMLLAIAQALVEKEGAEDAPDEVSNEAVTLTAGHLEDRIPGRLQAVDLPSVKLTIPSGRLGRASVGCTCAVESVGMSATCPSSQRTRTSNECAFFRGDEKPAVAPITRP